MIYIFLIALVVGFVVFSLRFAWWRADVSQQYPRVLMYHMVCEHLPKNTSKFNRLRVTPKAFERQLAWLKKHAWQSYTLSELAKCDEIPPKAVCITFDDGYKDNFTNAFFLLKKYGFKATIFVVTQRTNGDWASDKDLQKSSDELNAEPMLSDDEIKTMIESGLIEIGSHTINHANLPSLNSDEKREQIAHSAQILREKFGIKCESFAYPFGYFDDESVGIAKQAYFCAVITQNGVFSRDCDLHKIPRIMISGRDKILAFILKMKKGRCR